MDKAWQQAVAEFVGTLALVFVGAGSIVIIASGQSGGLVGVALAHGLTLAVMVTAIGHISGGHINPAVTVALWMTAKIESWRALMYIAAQLLGAIAGALLITAIFPKNVWNQEGILLGTPAVNPFFSSGKAVIAEAVMTFFLVFTVFATAVDERGAFQKVAGLPIGFVLTACILFGGPITGAALNPARALGPALISQNYDLWWVYWVGPLAGAVAAGILYWFAFLRVRAGVSPPIEPAVESHELPPPPEEETV